MGCWGGISRSARSLPQRRRRVRALWLRAKAHSRRRRSGAAASAAAALASSSPSGSDDEGATALVAREEHQRGASSDEQSGRYHISRSSSRATPFDGYSIVGDVQFSPGNYQRNAPTKTPRHISPRPSQDPPRTPSVTRHQILTRHVISLDQARSPSTSSATSSARATTTARRSARPPARTRARARRLTR